MDPKELKLSLTGRAAEATVNTLIKMNSVIGESITQINSTVKDVAFYDLIKKAYYYATQTELDLDNIDEKINDALILLLIEAKLAYEYFCEGYQESIELLSIINCRATQELMLINK